MDVEGTIRSSCVVLEEDQSTSCAVSEAQECYSRAKMMLSMGNFDEGVACIQQLLDTKKSNHIDRAIISKFIDLLASAYHTKGKQLMSHGIGAEMQLRLAIHFYQIHLKMIGNTDKHLEMKTHCDLGNSYLLRGKYRMGIHHLKKHLLLACQLGDFPAQRKSCTNLAHAEQMIGKVNHSLSFHKKALDIARQLGDTVITAQCLYSLAVAHLMTRDYKGAVAYFRSYLQLAQELNDEFGQCRAYWGLGKAYIKIGKLQTAVLCARNHLFLAEQITELNEIDIAKRNIKDVSEVLFNKSKQRGQRRSRRSLSVKKAIQH